MKKSPYKTPEEADRAVREAMKEHHHRMETDPEYRREAEKEMEYWGRILYPWEYDRENKKD